MINEIETPMTAREACKLLGCSYEFLLKKCQAGKVPHFRVGNRYFFRATTIQKWLAEQEQKSLQEPLQPSSKGIRRIIP